MPTIPPNDPLTATLQRQIRDLQREIQLLKQRPVMDDNPAQQVWPITFSYHGVVYGGDPSGHYLVPHFSATIHRLYYTARVASAFKTSWEVLLNDAVAYTFDLPANTPVLTVSDLALDIEEYDRIALNCVDDGTGQDSVVITLYATVVDGNEWN